MNIGKNITHKITNKINQDIRKNIYIGFKYKIWVRSHTGSLYNIIDKDTITNPIRNNRRRFIGVFF